MLLYSNSKDMCEIYSCSNGEAKFAALFYGNISPVTPVEGSTVKMSKIVRIGLNAVNECIAVFGAQHHESCEKITFNAKNHTRQFTRNNHY